MTNIHSALGHSFHLPFECPSFGIPRDTPLGPSVFLKAGDVPDVLEKPVLSRPLLQLDEQGSLLFHVPGIASYLLTDRAKITLSVREDGGLPRALDFLRDVPVAALCMQGGLIPLSAVCLSYRERSYLLWSPPGTGKTSLAMALVRRGFRWVADGLCALDMRGSHPLIQPGFPVIKLWPDSLEALSMPRPQGEPGPGGRFSISAAPWYDGEPRQLAAIALLRPARGGMATRCQRLQGGAAFAGAAKLVTLPAVARALGAEASFMQSLAGIASRVPVLDLLHPAGLEKLDEAADWLMEQILFGQGSD
ncbi:MAG: hypothetical protein ACOY5R_19255 [Pseudomonadota bacterium]